MQLWVCGALPSSKAQDSTVSPIVVSGNNVLFGTFDRNIYAIDKTTIAIKWTFKGGNWFWTAPIIKGGRIYAACLDGKIYAIDAENGQQVWQF